MCSIRKQGSGDLREGCSEDLVRFEIGKVLKLGAKPLDLGAFGRGGKVDLSEFLSELGIQGGELVAGT